MAEYASAKTGEYPSAFFFLARERTEFNKSYKLIASERREEFSHPVRSRERNPSCWAIFLNELAVIVNQLTINQRKFISIYF